MKKNIIHIRNLNRPAIRPLQARWCQSFFSRLQGFTFRSNLGIEEGLVLVEAHENRLDTSIHMFFVWTDLAVAWVNAKNEVVDNVLAKAWRPLYVPSRPARYVIELHPARHGDFRPGDRVVFDRD